MSVSESLVFSQLFAVSVIFFGKGTYARPRAQSMSITLPSKAFFI